MEQLTLEHWQPRSIRRYAIKSSVYCLTLGLGTLAAVVMSVPAYPAVQTAGSVAVNSRPTAAETDLTLAYEDENPNCGRGTEESCSGAETGHLHYGDE